MKTNLRMKCSNCGCWDRFEVESFHERDTSEPKVKAYIPTYEPLEFVKCKKCGQVISEPNELIRMTPMLQKPET